LCSTSGNGMPPYAVTPTERALTAKETAIIGTHG
jgi:hypothetical protein